MNGLDNVECTDCNDVAAREMKAKAGDTVDKIIADLCDRRGLRQEWEQIDPEIQEGIKKTWEKIVRGAG